MFKNFYAQELGVNYLLGKQVRSNARALSIFVNQFNATILTKGQIKSEWIYEIVN